MKFSGANNGVRVLKMCGGKELFSEIYTYTHARTHTHTHIHRTRPFRCSQCCRTCLNFGFSLKCFTFIVNMLMPVSFCRIQYLNRSCEYQTFGLAMRSKILTRVRLSHDDSQKHGLGVNSSWVSRRRFLNVNLFWILARHTFVGKE